MLRTLYDNDERSLEEYWTGYSAPEAGEWVYFPENVAKLDEDGYITVLGRVDEGTNVSGHRPGTMELESGSSTASRGPSAPSPGRRRSSS